MASSNESSTSKRRVGRRRLPPLEPGPALQFVVASHPDQFKAGNTMRHVRSHVMYKHRTVRKTTSNDRANVGLHRSASERGPSTTIPTVPISEEASNHINHLVPPQSKPRSSTWTGGLPDNISYAPTISTLPTIIHRTMSPTAEVCARSAPSISDDASSFLFPGVYGTNGDQYEALKQQYISNSPFFCNDRKWMEYVCSDQMSFLSHVSVSCVYQDLMNGLLHDSNTTMSAKTRVLSEMADRLEANNATILTILHLLLSEASSSDESAFRVHSQGLKGLIQRRGGLGQMPPQLATYVTLLLTTLAALKGPGEFCMLPVSSVNTHHAREHCPYVSPLYAPHGDFISLHDSCSARTLDILVDMYRLSQATLNRNTSPNIADSPPAHPPLYTRLLHSPPTQPSSPHDWIHESIRLAALIHTNSLLHPVPSEPARTTHTPPLFQLLLTALEHTDTTHSWGALRGVFLWVCLTGGIASRCARPPDQPVSASVAWARKCFSLWAVRAVGALGFAHADAAVEMLGCAVRVGEILSGRGA